MQNCVDSGGDDSASESTPGVIDTPTGFVITSTTTSSYDGYTDTISTVESSSTTEVDGLYFTTTTISTTETVVLPDGTTVILATTFYTETTWDATPQWLPPGQYLICNYDQNGILVGAGVATVTGAYTVGALAYKMANGGFSSLEGGSIGSGINYPVDGPALEAGMAALGMGLSLFMIWYMYSHAGSNSLCPGNEPKGTW